MTRRMLPRELDRLSDALAGADAAAGVGEPLVMSALYRLLGFGGRPVTPARLAAAVGWEEAHAQALLDRLPDVELDENGAVVGFGGLALRRTAHEIVVEGQVRCAWCAWDALFLPVALDTAVDVRSHCPQTGRPIGLTVAPSGVVERDPDSTALSFVHPGAVDVGDLRGSFCSAVHFLAEPSAPEHSRDQASNGPVLDLDDAFELGRRMIVNRCGCCPPG